MVRLIRDIARVINDTYGYDLFGEYIGSEVVEMLVPHVEALPEQAATSGRDFGRGYALAIKDVVDLLRGDG